MMETPTLEALAGSTLDTVTLDWRNAIALATFLRGGGSVSAYVLRATDVVALELPRSRSASKIVRSANVVGDRATIVMTSGEELQIAAGSFSIESLAQ